MQRDSGDALEVISEDIIHVAQILFGGVKCFGAGIKQMQAMDPRCDQHRPTAGAAAHVQADAAAGRQQMPGKDAKIIVENRLALLLRKMIKVLAKRGPFPAENRVSPGGRRCYLPWFACSADGVSTVHLPLRSPLSGNSAT